MGLDVHGVCFFASFYNILHYAFNTRGAYLTVYRYNWNWIFVQNHQSSLFGSSTRCIPDDYQCHFEWAVVGDSWSAGVSYSEETRYADSNNWDFCHRSSEAWGAQMENDTAWTEAPQNFNFRACGGALMDDIPRQLQICAGNPNLVMATIGGNDAFVSDIVKACIYQPPFTDYGPSFENDPDGTGLCKQLLAKSRHYIDETLSERFKQTLDDIFEFATSPNRRIDHFDLYISSYVELFNSNTSDCNDWSFALIFSREKPRLVQELREEMNTLVREFNEVQARVISNYKTPRPTYRVNYIPVSIIYEGHRFCEPGHSFEDQYHSPDIWLWNLLYEDSNPDSSEIIRQTLDGTTHMDIQLNFDNMEYPVRSLRGGKKRVEAMFPGLGGWTGRPFHPKFMGHMAMKDAMVQKLKKDSVPGVKS
jgi:hypothetical protein